MPDDYMSASWLKEIDRKESRIEFDGPKWNWPINKLLNESPLRLTRNDLQKRLQAS